MNTDDFEGHTPKAINDVLITEAADKIDELRRERDEARAEVKRLQKALLDLMLPIEVIISAGMRPYFAPDVWHSITNAMVTAREIMIEAAFEGKEEL